MTGANLTDADLRNARLYQTILREANLTGAKLGVERGCRRLDFSVIEMNPARGFYEAHGCRHLGDWLPYRVSDADLEKLAERPSRR